MIASPTIKGFAIKASDLHNFAVDQNLLNPTIKGIQTLPVSKVCEDAEWYMRHAVLFKNEDNMYTVRIMKEYQNNIDQRLCSMCWAEIGRRGRSVT